MRTHRAYDLIFAVKIQLNAIKMALIEESIESNGI